MTKQSIDLFTFKGEINHSTQRVVDLLINAAETGATTYWANIVVRHATGSADDMYDVTREDFHWSVIDREDDGAMIEINQDSVTNGLRLFATDAVTKRHYTDWMKEDDDAITADVFFQYIVFGEVRYS